MPFARQLWLRCHLLGDDGIKIAFVYSLIKGLNKSRNPFDIIGSLLKRDLHIVPTRIGMKNLNTFIIISKSCKRNPSVSAAQKSQASIKGLLRGNVYTNVQNATVSFDHVCVSAPQRFFH